MIKGKLRRVLPFASPFLFAIYPPLFLLSQNLSEYKLSVVGISLVISVVLASLIFLACFLITKKLTIAAPISSLLIIVSLSYGRFYEFFQGISFLENSPVPLKILYVALLFCVSCMFIGLLFVLKKQLATLNMLLSIMSLVLVSFVLYNIISFEIWEGRVFRKDNFLISNNTKEDSPVNSPDIYYFIFDRYAGQSTLDKYDFDNSEFINFLSDKGFYVASSSASNYPKTFLSLASSLNMEYMDNLTDVTRQGDSSDESIVTPYIQKNKVVEFLKNRGYSYIHMGSWWQPTTTNPNADKNFVIWKGTYWGTDEFTTGFINTTILSTILNRIRINPLNVSENPFNNDHRRRFFFEFKTAIQEIPQIPGPKFVFVHILAPHDPFVVDEDCTPINEKTVEQFTRRENYTKQLMCTNSQIKEVVTAILSSKNQSVIVLQADEGPFPMKYTLKHDDEWITADDNVLQEKFPILNAYYFPDKKYDQLYETISPVNSFRVIFNKYFGENLNLLEDRSYIFQDKNNLYKFLDVTEKVK